VFGGELQELLRETVVVLLLLERVVERRVTEILLSVGNEELFKLCVGCGVDEKKDEAKY